MALCHFCKPWALTYPKQVVWGVVMPKQADRVPDMTPEEYQKQSVKHTDAQQNTVAPVEQSAESSTESTPGWFADPTGQAVYRFWDGNKWTGYAYGDKVVNHSTKPQPVLQTALEGVVEKKGFSMMIYVSSFICSLGLLIAVFLSFKDTVIKFPQTEVVWIVIPSFSL